MDGRSARRRRRARRLAQRRWARWALGAFAVLGLAAGATRTIEAEGRADENQTAPAPLPAMREGERLGRLEAERGVESRLEELRQRRADRRAAHRAELSKLSQTERAARLEPLPMPRPAESDEGDESGEQRYAAEERP